MTYESKIEAVRTIITQHNTHCDETSKIDVEAFVKRLKASGGTTNDALKLSSWEDIESLQIPRLLARQIATVFRQEEKTEKAKPISEKKAALLNPRELLEHFDSKQGVDTPVGAQLEKLSKGKPFLVYKEDGTLNVTASLECLEDIRNNYEPRTVYIQDGVPTRVCVVGQQLETTVSENPLFPGNPLRGSDDMCHKTHRKWKGIPHKARVILNLAVSNRELVVDQLGTIHDILDRFVDKKDTEILTWVMTRYPQASLKYAELEMSGNLPSLKIVRGAIGTNKQDPFFGGSGNRNWAAWTRTSGTC